MAEVSWSSTIHVYTPESRLSDFLADVKRIAEAPPGREPGYLAIRFGAEEWYVLPVRAASHLPRRLGSYDTESRFRAHLSGVPIQLKAEFVRAFVLGPGQSRSVTLPPNPA